MKRTEDWSGVEDEVGWASGQVSSQYIPVSITIKSEPNGFGYAQPTE